MKMPPDGKTASVPTELIATELRAFVEKQETANRNKRNRIREQLIELQTRDKSILEVLIVIILILIDKSDVCILWYQVVWQFFRDHIKSFCLILVLFIQYPKFYIL